MEICDKFLCVNRKNKECHVPKNIVAFTCKHTNAPCPKARCEYCDVKECEKQYYGRIDRMSMISEQVKEIKACAYAHEASGDAIYGTANILYQAADTIEALSAKLQAANMEGIESSYGTGWISANRPPKSNKDVLVRYNSVKMGIGWYCERSKRWWTCDGCVPVEWRPLPED